MVRILVLFAVVSAILAVHWLLNATPESIGKRLRQAAWILAAALVLVLLFSGKLNGVLALAGVVLAFFIRSLPVVLKYAPQLHNLWRYFKTGKSEQATGPGQQRYSGTSMSKNQAYEVLGLQPGASEEQIIQAHRKLISRLHPDRGGSDYLAAQINQAKKVLLGR